MVGKLLILGIFLYFGATSIIDPSTFARLIPNFVGNILNPAFVVTLHGMVEMICALFILFKIGGRWPWYLLIAAFLGVLVSVSSMTLARDLAIMGGLLLISTTFADNKNA